MYPFLHIFVLFGIYILSSLLFLWSGAHGWLCSLSENCNFWTMINKIFFFKLYQYLKGLFYSSSHPLPLSSLFCSNVFSLTYFRLSRRSWTGVTNVPIGRNNHCLRKQWYFRTKDRSKGLLGLHISTLHLREMICISQGFHKHYIKLKIWVEELINVHCHQISMSLPMWISHQLFQLYVHNSSFPFGTGDRKKCWSWNNAVTISEEEAYPFLCFDCVCVCVRV